MRRGLFVAVVTALIASTVPSPALAQGAVQETPGKEEYCAGLAAAAYQYDCEVPRSPECAPQQQYAEDETGGCIVDPDQYGTCTAQSPCDADVQEQSSQDSSVNGVLPPASVRNIVVDAARSVTKDAPEASRALDTAQLKDTADNVALAAEVEPVAEPPENQPPANPPPAEQPPANPPQTPEETVEEPPAYVSGAPEGVVVEGATVPPAAEVPYSTATPADTVEAAETTGIAELTEVKEPIEAKEPPEVVDGQEKQQGMEEADGESVASYGLAPVDQFMVPLFALGGSTLLVGGGLLVRRIIG